MASKHSAWSRERLKRNVDGGWAYMILIATMGFFFMYAGTSKSLGVMLPTLKEQLNTHTWLLGSIFSVNSAIQETTAIVAALLSRRLPIRYIVMVGGTLAALGMIFASLAQAVAQFGISLCIFQGLGFGFSMLLMETTLGHYFHKKYACAYGVAASGVMFGFIAIAPLTQLLLDVYGWRGSMLIVGGISLNLLPLAALTRPLANLTSNTYAESVENGRSPEENLSELELENLEPGSVNPERRQSSRRSLAGRFVSVVKSGATAAIKASDAALFREFSFLVVLLNFCIMKFISTALIIYLVPRALDMGFGKYEASLSATMFGIGGLIGKFAYGPFVDRKIVRRRTMLFLSTSLLSAILFVDHLMTTLPVMLAGAAVLGAGAGISNCMIMVVNRRVVGINRLAISIGWTSVIAAPFRVLAGFLPGWLYDQTNSYSKVFIILGGVVALSPIALLVEGVYRRFYAKKAPADVHWEGVLDAD